MADPLSPLEAAVERAAQLAETLGPDHADTRAALAVVEEERRAEQVRTQYPPRDLGAAGAA